MQQLVVTDCQGKVLRRGESLEIKFHGVEMSNAQADCSIAEEGSRDVLKIAHREHDLP